MLSNRGRLSLVACCLLVSGFFAGCSSGPLENPNWPKRVKATGSVHYQDKPVEGAVVTFVSNDGKSTATGQTDANGKFRLTTYVEGDGAVPGSHVVTVYCAKVVDNPQGCRCIGRR